MMPEMQHGRTRGQLLDRIEELEAKIPTINEIDFLSGQLATAQATIKQLVARLLTSRGTADHYKQSCEGWMKIAKKRKATIERVEALVPPDHPARTQTKRVGNNIYDEILAALKEQK